LLSLLGSFSELLSACRVIGNLSLVEFSGGSSFSSFFSLVVLASQPECFLLGILLGLSIFAYSRVYISSCYSVLEFSFFILKIPKYTFCVLAFDFWVV
jgi:hypothetical protein